ncbi:MAG TPA: glycosyltransferase [Pyrinomonadaceae bacterium]|nr:glycosyltransferase [Pyrinomonadaceae bacterium]
MPKVLILGLYYPPANFIAGRRLEGWARYLPSFGYEPLILTRYYDPEERNGHDFYASSRPTRTLKEPWVESNGTIYTRFEQGAWAKLPLPGKIRGLAHFARPDPDHSVWYRQCSDYLDASGFKPDIIIGSYGPPAMFLIARRLARRFGVPWIADYRDIWIELFDQSLATRLKYSLQRRHLRSAAGITAASEGVVDALRKQLSPLEKPIRLIYNGAEPFENVQPDSNDSEVVEAFRDILRRNKTVLTYTGTLYPPQQIELLFNAVTEFNGRNGKSCAVVLCGRHDRAQYARWPFVHVLGPVSHQTALFFQRESTASFYPTWWPEKYTGFSGKIFEMILSGRPALVFCTPPPDLEALGRRFKSIIVIKEPEALTTVLERLPGMRAEIESDSTRELATKRYAAGELAHFMDEILQARDLL